MSRAKSINNRKGNIYKRVLYVEYFDAMISCPQSLKDDIVHVSRSVRDALRFAQNLNEGVDGHSKLAAWKGHLCGVHTLLDYKIVRDAVAKRSIEAWGEN